MPGPRLQPGLERGLQSRKRSLLQGAAPEQRARVAGPARLPSPGAAAPNPRGWWWRASSSPPAPFSQSGTPRNVGCKLWGPSGLSSP